MIRFESPSHIYAMDMNYNSQTLLTYQLYFTELKIGRFNNADLSFMSSTMYYIQSVGYPVSSIPGGSSYACSVETDCLETVMMSLIDIRLVGSTGTCEQSVTITDGSSTHTISCSENNDYIINREYYTSQENYLLLELKSTSTTDGGYLWLGIQGKLNQSILISHLCRSNLLIGP